MGTSTCIPCTLPIHDDGGEWDRVKPEDGYDVREGVGIAKGTMRRSRRLYVEAYYYDVVSYYTIQDIDSDNLLRPSKMPHYQSS